MELTCAKVLVTMLGCWVVARALLCSYKSVFSVSVSVFFSRLPCSYLSVLIDFELCYGDVRVL